MIDPAAHAKDRIAADGSEERKSESVQEERVSPSAFHRTEFVSPEQKAQGRYDIAVLILSGGALGLCLVIGQDYLRLRGGGGSVLLAAAMLCWALSVSCILFSWKTMRLADVGATSGSLSSSGDMVSALSTGSGVLFLFGAVFFAAYVASEPRADAKPQLVPRATEEITRLLSLYDGIRDVCPECSAAEARKVLQACEGSYVVPDVLREACPHCSEKAVLHLDRRCMEKWNMAR